MPPEEFFTYIEANEETVAKGAAGKLQEAAHDLLREAQAGGGSGSDKRGGPKDGKSKGETYFKIGDKDGDKKTADKYLHIPSLETVIKPEAGIGKGAAKASDRSDFVASFQRNFNKLDQDGDGTITQSEVNKAIQDRTFTGADARMVIALKDALPQLEKLRDFNLLRDGAILAASGASAIGLHLTRESSITMAEVLKFGEIQRSVRAEDLKIRAVEQLGKDSFAKIDQGGDGFISRSDLDQALASGQWSAHEREALQYMRLKIGKIQTASNDEWGFENDGITAKDIGEFANTFRNSENYKLVAQIDSTMGAAADDTTTAGRDLFADRDNPLASIRPDAVRQGGVGDCYFLAALASLAQTNPQAIKDMIKDNRDGTYTVTFPGAPNEPITVSAPTEQELSLYARGTEHGVWAAVMEKAYGTYRNNHRWFFQPESGTPSEGGDGGGLLHMGLNILTGTSADTDIILLSTEAGIEAKIQEALRGGRPVTCGTARNVASIIGLGEDKTTDGLPGGHAYSVIGYDPETRTVLVRNPWGHGETTDANGGARDGTDDGVFRMSLSEFKRNFTMVAFAGK